MGIPVRHIGCRSARSGRAFTLIEVMVVLVIVGILAGLAVVGFRRMQAESNLESSAQRLLLDIRKAKIAANRSDLRHYVYFPAGGTKWEVMKSADATFSATADDTVSIDSLAAGVSFGPQSGSSFSASVSSDLGTVSWGSYGFGTINSSQEDCVDGSAYKATIGTASGWAKGSGGLIVACGGATADLSIGIVGLSAKNTTKAYAIGYNDASQIQVRLFRYTGSAWEEVQ